MVTEKAPWTGYDPSRNYAREALLDKVIRELEWSLPFLNHLDWCPHCLRRLVGSIQRAFVDALPRYIVIPPSTIGWQNRSNMLVPYRLASQGPFMATISVHGRMETRCYPTKLAYLSDLEIYTLEK